MSHPFGDLLTQHLHRKHGLSQARLAAGILQEPSIIAKMGKGQRLNGVQARERVLLIVGWLHQQGVLDKLDEANALLMAAGLAPLREADAVEARLLQQLRQVPPHAVLEHHNLDGNFPQPLTSFIGRDADVNAVIKLLQRSDMRLTTLVGPPGVGKTRLAVEICREVERTTLNIENEHSIKSLFPDGTNVVLLAPIIDPSQVTSAIAQAIGLATAQAEPMSSLKLHLRDQQMLLVLDNFEHLSDAALVVAELLAAAPKLKVLTTSRVALNLSQEFVMDVRPLTTPEATQLFTARATSLQIRFASTSEHDALIHDICLLLDGLPLAIELAVAKLRAFNLHALRDQLNADRLSVLRDGPRDRPSHQRTLRDTIAWSYHLLQPEQQQLLRSLSVFAGGGSLPAVVAVAGLGDRVYADLQVLIDSNLVLRDDNPGGEPRYGMLALIREYAAEQLLAHSELQSVCQAHALYYLNAVKTSAPSIFQQEQSTLRSEEGAIGMDDWLATLKHEHANLSKALTWSLGSGQSEAHDPKTGAELVLWMYWFWFRFGPWHEAVYWQERAVSALEPLGLPHLRARLLSALAYFVGPVRTPARAESVAQEALMTLIACEDMQATAMTWKVLGTVQILCRRLIEARRSCEEHLAIGRAIGDHWHISVALYYLGEIALYTGEFARVEELCQQYEEVHAVDNLVLFLRATLACCQAKFDEAEVSGQQSLAFCQEKMWFHSAGTTWHTLADISFFRGDLWHAHERFINGLRIFGNETHKQRAAWCLSGLAAVLAAMGDATQAVTLWSIAEAIYTALGFPNLALRHDDYRECVLTVQNQLRPYELAAAVSMGQSLPFENAIAYALSVSIPSQFEDRAENNESASLVNPQ